MNLTNEQKENILKNTPTWATHYASHHEGKKDGFSFINDKNEHEDASNGAIYDESYWAFTPLDEIKLTPNFTIHNELAAGMKAMTSSGEVIVDYVGKKVCVVRELQDNEDREILLHHESIKPMPDKDQIRKQNQIKAIHNIIRDACLPVSDKHVKTIVQFLQDENLLITFDGE